MCSYVRGRVWYLDTKMKQELQYPTTARRAIIFSYEHFRHGRHSRVQPIPKRLPASDNHAFMNEHVCRWSWLVVKESRRERKHQRRGLCFSRCDAQQRLVLVVGPAQVRFCFQAPRQRLPRACFPGMSTRVALPRETTAANRPTTALTPRRATTDSLLQLLHAHAWGWRQR